MDVVSRLTLPLIAIVVIACAVSSKVRTNETYRDISFTVPMLESEGLSILPVITEAGVEGYRRPFGEALNATADSLLEGVSFWQDTMDDLNEGGIVSQYNAAIESYSTTSILDRSLLSQMQEATGSRYFLYVRLAPPSSDRRVSYNSLTGVSTTQSESVSAFGQIWDAELGDVVWEGASDATVTTGDYTYTKETTMDRALKAAEGLMALLLQE